MMNLRQIGGTTSAIEATRQEDAKIDESQQQHILPSSSGRIEMIETMV